jgi:DNA polymerase-3 subunit beta
MTTMTKDRKTTKRGHGVTLNAAEFKRAMQTVSPAVPHKSAKPVLQNVLLADGVLSGTDLELRIDTTIDYTGPAVLLPHARLLAIMGAAQGDEVTLDPDGPKCTVRCGRGEWTLPTEDANEFPASAVEGEKPVTRLPADQFLRAVNGTVFAADTESSRYALGAVLVEVKDGTVWFVSTDGRRMSVVECEHDLAVDDSQTLVPSRVMAVLGRLAAYSGDESSVQLETTGRQVIATIGDTTVTASLVEGRFPKWREVLPSRDVEPTTVLPADLLSATRAAGIVTTETSKGITLAITGEGIHLTGRSSEAGESSVTCDIVSAGKSAVVKLDPAYLVEFLRSLPADGEPEVTIEAVDAESAVVLRSGDHTGVIMPMAQDA